MTAEQEKTRKRIRNDLRKQLKADGVKGNQFVDAIEDYMSLWDTKNLLLDDIRARGVTYTALTTAGPNTKKNESVGELVKVVGQMIKLRESIGIKPAAAGGEDDEL